MSDYFLDQIAELRRQVADLKQGRVTYRAATVAAVNTGTSTFDADVSGAGNLSGIAAEPSFLPAVGDTVRLSLVGATPIYQPHRIGEDAVGYTELAPVVGGDISNAILTSTNAMTAANGKNKVTYSAVAAPTSGISGTVAGDPWFQRNTTTGVVTGSWEWDGDSWEPRSYGDQVLNGLTAGKITAGTINADVLVAGQVATGTSGQRAGINSLGLFAYNSAGTKTVDLNGVNNLITGTMQSALTGRRIVTGASGATGEMSFIAPDGKTSYVRSFTEGSGIEALQIGVNQATVTDNSLWNRININSDEWMTTSANKVDFQYLAGSGSFYVRERSIRDVGATTTARIQVDSANGTILRSPNGATAYVVGNNAHTFFPTNSATSGWVRVKPNLVVDSNFRSAQIELATDNNGVAGAGAYAGTIKYIMRTGGVNPAFSIRNGDDSAGIPIEASAFNVATSSEKVKTDIVDMSEDALPLVKKTKARRYRLKNEQFPDEQIGLVIEESPSLILGSDGGSIDLYRMITLLWKAVQELDDKIPGGPRP